MEEIKKTISPAFILIRAIKISKHIVAIDKLDAIEDITRMLVDKEYAKRVYFNNDAVDPDILIEELLYRLFDNNKSEMLQDFYVALGLNLSRSNSNVKTINTNNKFYRYDGTNQGDPPNDFDKPRVQARLIIIELKRGNRFITNEDSLAAIEDIQRMLDDRKYAKSVDFGMYKFEYKSGRSTLLNLFSLSKTELGEVFYNSMWINLERSGLWGWNNFFGGLTYEKTNPDS